MIGNDRARSPTARLSPSSLIAGFQYQLSPFGQQARFRRVQLLVVADTDIIVLLNHAHAARGEAARARRLAGRQADAETRRIMLRFSRELDARADELEVVSLSIVPTSLKARGPDGVLP